MKKILLIAALGLALVSQAQIKGTVKLYGYRQAVSGGKAPEMDSSGVATVAPPGQNLFVYAVSKAEIHPTQIWIDGKPFGTSVRKIAQLPVERSDGETKKVLVPKSKGVVIQIAQVAATGKATASTTLKKAAASNALVLVYTQRGKTYYVALKNLEELDPAVGY